MHSSIGAEITIPRTIFQTTKELNDEGFVEDSNGYVKDAVISDKDIAIDIGF